MPGVFYADAIVEALNASQLLIVVLSADSAGSQHVLREVERASSKKRPLVAFRLDAAPPPTGLEYFLSASHWLDASAIPLAVALPQLITAVRHILAVPALSTVGGKASTTPLLAPQVQLIETRPNERKVAQWTLAFVAIALLIGGSLLWQAKRTTGDQTAAPATRVPSSTNANPDPTIVPFAPPAHSIAVLPFVNMSGDPKQDYFSDGVSEELLDSLSRLNGLQVAARTSSFSFKGQNVDAATIAHKLNVSAILEGSVRRAGNTVRITAQLINTVTGFHMWSQSYDRNVTDVLKVQTDVTTAVARQLEATLAADEAAKINIGRTTNTDAYDAYLQGLQLLLEPYSEANYRKSLEYFDRAVALDPRYAAAHIGRASALTNLASDKDNQTRETLNLQAIASAERAPALAPDFGEAHAILATVRRHHLDFAAAAREYERALELAPGSAQVQRTYSYMAAILGRFVPAIAAARRAVLLDPQGYVTRMHLSRVFEFARRFPDALATLKQAEILRPHSEEVEDDVNYVLLGSNQIAQMLTRCESPATALEEQSRYQCLALAYHALRRQADAEREFGELQFPDSGAYNNAAFFAQWGDKTAALSWLAKAEQIRDSDLQWLKVDFVLDPVRDEPQFKELVTRMKFPP
jgi:TolB-like protein/tetratricopeptide (TPR) repeat protein